MIKKKIIIFHPYSKLGGADRSLYRLLKKLNKKKYSITFVSIDNSIIKDQLRREIKFISLNGSE